MVDRQAPARARFHLRLSKFSVKTYSYERAWVPEVVALGSVSAIGRTGESGT